MNTTCAFTRGARFLAPDPCLPTLREIARQRGMLVLDDACGLRLGFRSGKRGDISTTEGRS